MFEAKDPDVCARRPSSIQRKLVFGKTMTLKNNHIDTPVRLSSFENRRIFTQRENALQRTLAFPAEGDANLVLSGLNRRERSRRPAPQGRDEHTAETPVGQRIAGLNFLVSTEP